MANKTGIEWTDATWNPTRGCTRVSEGCRNCYAEKVAYRFSGPGQPYEGLVRIGADGERRAEWNSAIRFVESHLLDPLKWKPVRVHEELCGKTKLGTQAACTCRDKFATRPLKIFVDSMSDLFHDGVTEEQLDRVFAVMALCPQHIFQVLTKRPERMLAYLGDDGTWARVVTQMEALVEQKRAAEGQLFQALVTGMPLPNMWSGVSVEDQKTADARIPLLLQTHAAVRFLSAEPLLGRLNLCQVGPPPWPLFGPLEGYCSRHFPTTHCGCGRQEPCIDWVICGGESGPGARPMHPDWVRGVRDQCAAAGVPFFFKQWGEWAPYATHFAADHEERQPWDLYVNRDGSTGHASLGEDGLISNWTGHMQEGLHFVSRVGKKGAGDLLDGKQWHQLPEVRGC